MFGSVFTDDNLIGTYLLWHNLTGSYENTPPISYVEEFRQQIVVLAEEIKILVVKSESRKKRVSL